MTPSAPSSWGRVPPYRFALLLIAAFVLLMIFVRPVVIGGDAALYADDIEKSLPHGWGESPQLWNFAHVLWRPMGRLLSELFLNALRPRFGGSPNLTIGFLLMLPNLAAALICGLALQIMIWNLTGNRWMSLLAAFAFLCLSPLLHYSRLGSPYITGIALTTLATYFAGFCPVRSWRAAALAGLFAGAAVLCWAPFLASFPAIVLSTWILNRSENGGLSRLSFALLICAVAGIVAAAFYLLVMNIAGIHGLSGLMAWIHASSADSKDAKGLRMITGIARGFYELGDDAIWLKWYKFHDPYAKVGFVDVVRGALLRIALFYLALLGLAVLLWRAPLGKRLLLFIAIAMLPHLALALSYESGSPERYVGFLPALFLGFGYAMGAPEFSAGRRLIAALLCCLPIPFNLASASERNVSDAVQKDPARLRVLLSVGPESRLYVINGFDPLSRLSFGDPLNPLHARPMGVVKGIGAFGRPVMFWRVDFACDALWAADHGGEVWVSKRLLAAQPERGWLWVEGDVPGLSWRSIQAYFSTFDTSVEQGGADGFFRISPVGETRQRLLSEIAASGQSCDASR